MTVPMFTTFWQKVSSDLTMPGTEAGGDASYVEWTGKMHGSDCKFQGMRKAGAKHGIVRTISKNGGWIEEGTYCDDKNHGLSFEWPNHPIDTIAFRAAIFDHGEEKAEIWWKADWSEYHSSGNKELILENNGLSIFKP